MLELKRLGLGLVALALLAPLIWLPGMVDGRDTLALFSQYLGMTALIAMATLQIIATRWPGVEAVFGPMDQSYRLHKWLGLWALAASFLHDTIDADIRGVGEHTFLTGIAETAGEVSLYGLLLLVTITVATFIPYHLWKWTHRFIGVFFVLSAFHYLFIQKPFSNGDALGLYMGLICTLGLLAYAYTSAPRQLRPARRYRVSKLTKTGSALSVDLMPEGRPLKHRAGQFVFISFTDIGMSEPHPFTLSAAPQQDGRLRVSIGPLGDYTLRLMSRLEEGALARVEGPFGNFKMARGPQVWVAAGIGITPFAAMAGRLADTSESVTLLYSVKDKSSAAHLEELEAAAAAHDHFNFVLRETSNQGRLQAQDVLAHMDDVARTHVLYCGPATLRKTLWDGLRDKGLSARRFHYELFEIRTGVGLATLFAKLVERSSQLKKTQAGAGR